MGNINEIAKIAKVSRSTVSRVINDHPYVSPAKREAVLQAMQQLNYVPNANAINLIKGKTRIIGFLIPRFNHPFFNQLAESITRECKKRGYHLLICLYENLEEEKTFYHMLSNKQIDGLILGSSVSQRSYIEELSSYGPIVSCEKLDSDRISSVYIDHEEGISIALHHLYQKGYRSIGFCIGSLDSIVGSYRYQAFQSFMANKKIPLRKEWVFSKNYAVEDGVSIADQLQAMQPNERPEALVVGSDLIAAGIQYRCKQLGLDIALIGFDNQPISEIFDITTIHQPISELGSIASQYLFEEINKTRMVQCVHTKLNVHLIERNSC